MRPDFFFVDRQSLRATIGIVDRKRGGEGVTMSMHGRIVRRALGSGRWYPREPAVLRRAVTEFIEAAAVPPITGRIVGAIAPHAGYVYSGPVAGYTFRALREQAARGLGPTTVVVLGFPHRGGFPGVAFLDGDALATPLGEAPLDPAALALLMEASPRLQADARPHAGEHSAENEVPFVQAALPNAKLVVGLIGDHTDDTLNELNAGLARLAARQALVVVASSDMLHDPDYDRVTRTDQATLRRLAALDAAGLQRDWSYERQTLCGLAPVLATLRFALAQGCRQGTVLRYRNSGDDHPESRGDWVVGYGAVVFTI